MNIRISKSKFVAGVPVLEKALLAGSLSQNSRRSRMLRQRRSCSKDTMWACSPASFSRAESKFVRPWS